MPGQISPNSPSWSASIPTNPFHFRLRVEPIDWRRMAALDVDRVARETDINMLQEFISAVTFCAVEGERCPQCRCPTDATLLKILQMSQLSTEYLLHCQEYLSSHVAVLEERLQAALSQALREEEERSRLEKELQEVRLESRRRKKLIATQQLLLQSSANNYHKCQFCEKSFVNYSFLQSHVQRRHTEITDAERQKKLQVEQMKDGLEELKEKLRQTQSRHEAEREADTQRRQQELEEQRRREATDREKTERYKEEEKRTFHDEINGLRHQLHQEFEKIKTKNVSIESKLQELEIKERNMTNLRGEEEFEKEQKRIKEKELHEQMVQEKNKWRMKIKEQEKRHQQEREELESENARLQKALSVTESTNSSIHSLKQQILSLSTQLRDRDTLIHSQKQKIKKLMSRSRSDQLPKMAAQNSLEDVEDGEKIEVVEEVLAVREEPVSGIPVQRKNFRPIMQKRLQNRLEKLGLRKGTKGISTQTLKSLINEHEQTFRSRSQLQDLRIILEAQLKQRVRELQKSQGKSLPNAHMLQRKKLHSPVMEQIPTPRQVTPTYVTQRREIHQLPPAAPRSKAPTLTPILPAQQKQSSTPPFTSEEEDDDESGEDSAYITNSRDKPSTSVHLTSAKEQPKAGYQNSWSDSDESEESNKQKPHQAFTTRTDVQTLTTNLEKQLSNTTTTLAGGIRVLPPASQPSPRTSIIKQQAVSEEESDLDLSSIEELIALPASGRGCSDAFVTSGTNVWSSTASRVGAW